MAADSAALIGFGFDWTFEIAAAAVVVWQFRSEMSGKDDEERERRALKVIAITFFALTAYVVYEAARTVLARKSPEASTVGMALAGSVHSRHADPGMVQATDCDADGQRNAASGRYAQATTEADRQAAERLGERFLPRQ